MRKKIKKIHFISVPSGLEQGQVKKPFYSNAPMAFLWLAAYLESKGMDCQILDAYTAMLDTEEILLDIENYQPDIVGLSVFTISVYDNLFLANKIREKFPEVVIVFGGYHVNHHYNEILKNRTVDFCILKEGEVSLWELIECLNHDDDLSKVKGIVWNEDGQIRKTGNRSFCQKLDSMPILPYEKVAHNNYSPWCFSKSNKGKFMQSVTSKGCPMQCMFCDIAKTEGKKFRCMAPERVLKEVEHLYYQVGANQIEFLDALFTTNRRRVKDISRMIIERKIDIDWACSSSILHADDIEMLDVMRQSGCRTVFYGVESGNPQMVRKVKKVSLDDVKRVVDMTKKIGIRAHASFIFGLPGETKETMRETVEFAKDLNPDSVSFSIAIPSKGTELYDIYRDQIIITDYRKFAGSAVFCVPEYTPQYIEEMVIKAHREFYLRPKYILSRLRNVATWEDFCAHAKIGIDLLRGKLCYKSG